MAKQEKITVELSPQDRRLLEQSFRLQQEILKAVLALASEDRAEAQAGVRRLVETPTFAQSDIDIDAIVNEGKQPEGATHYVGFTD